MIPVANLNQEEAISPELAARLAMTMLGHMLYLKSQVPFPVMQLGRLPFGGKAHDRVRKKRNELLESLDQLGYELPMALYALSTCLGYSIHSSLSPSPPYIDPPSADLPETLTPSNSIQSPAAPLATSPKGTSHILFIVGPSVSMAKACIVTEISGVEIITLVSSNEQDDDGDGPPDSDCEYDSSDIGDEDIPTAEDEQSTSPAPSKDENAPANNPRTSGLFFQSVDASYKAAERLLSRTLACSDTLIDELAPTHIHILLHAPRRFDREAWVPKPNYSKKLNSYLDDFKGTRDASQASPLSSATSSIKPKNKPAAEGVRIVWNKESSDTPASSGEPETGVSGPREGTVEASDDDELMWFQWEGKLSGFADMV